MVVIGIKFQFIALMPDKQLTMENLQLAIVNCQLKNRTGKSGAVFVIRNRRRAGGWVRRSWQKAYLP